MSDNFPSVEKLRSIAHAVAIVECPEAIACNPCSTVCKFGAIYVPKVDALPIVDIDKCTGCTQCLQICPGLAIHMVKVEQETAEISVPYEFLPMPEKGETVSVLNRRGEVIGEGEVVRILSREKSIGDTAVVTFRVNASLAEEARDILVQQRRK